MNEMKQYYTSETDIIAMQEELCHARSETIKQNNTYIKEKLKRYGGKGMMVLMICLFLKLYIDVETARANGETPTVFGYQVYEVQSGSMDPTLPVKSLIVSKKYDIDEPLETGDIITFEHDGTIITHRIIEVHQDGAEYYYTTKGDNAQNSIDSKPVYPNEIKAVFVTKLPFYLSNGEREGDDHE